MALDAQQTRGFTHTWPTSLEKSWAKLVKVTKMVKKLGQDDPRRIIHSLKVGFALALVLLLQQFHPSFYGFGANIIWAVITVVLVLEFSVGATLGKGLNRMLATLLAGALGVAIHRIATLSGEKGKVVLSSTFVIVIAATATFMRFFPRLKARYDYGLVIFMLTFCMVSLSDNTEDELWKMAYERLLTIIIGSCIAIMVCICICPVWVGEDLHNQITGSIEKLADFLEGFGDDYFKNSENTEAVDDEPFLHRYKSVLSSKSSEQTMAVLARWEPCHGRFRFRHPWKQYLEIGKLLRLCAYKIEALSVYLLHPKEVWYYHRNII
ncbi:aluminum-activated malate transporter 2-like [Gastrolobium bilobum]|uniref:aluminum-activated malate transporter 2-like n=1 Tax=Gastrolobium bilobum TaxID=150636 RepID=UPI002AB0E5D5|nr:aluminum-activated malate transporter 2-like [Gastrolobium bilobum]